MFLIPTEFPSIPLGFGFSLFIFQKLIVKRLENIVFVNVPNISLRDDVRISHWATCEPYRQKLIFSSLRERFNKKFYSEMIEKYSFGVGIKKK